MTREEAVKEIEKAFEPAFANYIIIALTEGTTVSDIQHRWGRAYEAGVKDGLEQRPMVEIDLDYVIKQKYIEREVLDKIRAEIKEWQTDIHDNEYDAETYDFVFERIYEILDKYKVEGEGRE